MADILDEAQRLNQQGLTQKAQGNVRGAIEAFEAAISMGEQLYYFEADHNLGVLLQEIGDLDGSAQRLVAALNKCQGFRMRVLQGRPDSGCDQQEATIRNTLGNTYKIKAQQLMDVDPGAFEAAWAAAAEQFNGAIQLAPSYGTPYNGMGNLHAMKSDFQNAAVCFEKCLRFLPPDSPLRPKVMQILAMSQELTQETGGQAGGGAGTSAGGGGSILGTVVGLIFFIAIIVLVYRFCL